jgi:predicted ATPase
MLERVHIENFKCLRDVTVELGDFTILIGPNDSGKSSFLDAIQTLGKVIRQDYSELFRGDRALENLVWQKDTERRIIWKVTGVTGENEFSYDLELPINEGLPGESLEWDGDKLFWTTKLSGGRTHPAIKIKQGAEVPSTFEGPNFETALAKAGRTYLQRCIESKQVPFTDIAKAISSSTEFRFEPSQMAIPSQPHADEVLSPSGDNLAAFLDVLLSGPRRADFVALEGDLRREIPTLQGIHTPPSSLLPGAKLLHFILAGDRSEPVTIPASLVSSGALLLTAFLSLAYSKTEDILLFEEPENGLHPSRLELVIDILRKMSTGEVGNRKRQIIMTTHNPLLLNYAKPEEVRIFVRDPAQGTRVFPMSEVSDLDRLLKEFALGELWYLLGEEKLMEKQPL